MSNQLITKLSNKLTGAAQSGDTIVEVMISIAVVALAISLAYSISGKNLAVGITARERTQAVGLVQGQIELLKQARQNGAVTDTSLKDSNYHFCLDSSAKPHKETKTVNPLGTDLSTDAANYMADCISGGKYYLDATYVQPGGAGANAYGNSLMFTARWYRLGGGPDQIVTLYYRPW